MVAMVGLSPWTTSRLRHCQVPEIWRSFWKIPSYMVPPMGSSQAAFLLSKSWCWKGTLFFLRSRKPQRVKSSPLPGHRSQPACPPSVPAAPIPVAGLGSGRKAKVHLTHDWEKWWLFLFCLNTRNWIVFLCCQWRITVGSQEVPCAIPVVCLYILEERLVPLGRCFSFKWSVTDLNQQIFVLYIFSKIQMINLDHGKVSVLEQLGLWLRYFSPGSWCACCPQPCKPDR